MLHTAPPPILLLLLGPFRSLLRESGSAGAMGAPSPICSPSSAPSSPPQTHPPPRAMRLDNRGGKGR